MKTLHVRIEDSDSFFDRAEQAVDELDESTGRTLSVPDEDALARVFSAENLRLVRAIAQNDPSSMRDVASIVGRDIKNVSQNLNELEELGLIDLIDEGRAMRPVVPYDAMAVFYPLGS